MKWHEFHKQILDTDIKLHKRSVRIYLYSLIVYAVGLIYLGFAIYNNPSNLVNPICFGSVFASFIFLYTSRNMEITDLKMAQKKKIEFEKIGHEESITSFELVSLKSKLDSMSIKFNEIADENKTLRSKLQAVGR